MSNEAKVNKMSPASVRKEAKRLGVPTKGSLITLRKKVIAALDDEKAPPKKKAPAKKSTKKSSTKKSSTKKSTKKAPAKKTTKKSTKSKAPAKKAPAKKTSAKGKKTAEDDWAERLEEIFDLVVELAEEMDIDLLGEGDDDEKKPAKKKSKPEPEPEEEDDDEEEGDDEEDDDEEPDEEEAEEEEVTEIPKSIKKFFTEDDDGDVELNMAIEDVDALSERQLRAMCEVLGVETTDVPKKRMRVLQNRLREKLVQENVATVQLVAGQSVTYTDDEGTEYPAIIAEEEDDDGLEEGLVRVYFPEDENAWDDVPFSQLTVE